MKTLGHPEIPGKQGQGGKPCEGTETVIICKSGCKISKETKPGTLTLDFQSPQHRENKLEQKPHDVFLIPSRASSPLSPQWPRGHSKLPCQPSCCLSNLFYCSSFGGSSLATMAYFCSLLLIFPLGS